MTEFFKKTGVYLLSLKILSSIQNLYFINNITSLFVIEGKISFVRT